MNDFVDEIFKKGIKIDKACRKHAKDNNVDRGEIICPICEELREYYIASNNHLHTDCKCLSVSQ